LCGKLESWGIDPPTLVKAIGIFLMLVILITTFIIFPALFGIVWISIICIAVIALIYNIIEPE
jgi:hypothetical protein